MALARRFLPLRAELWRKSVAFKGGVDFGDHGRARQRQRLRVDLGAADDPGVGRLTAQGAWRRPGNGRPFAPAGLPVALARHHDVEAPGQRAGKRAAASPRSCGP